MITQDRQSFRINGAALRRQPRAAFALFIVLLLPTVVSAASMKLVAPNTGWAAYDNRLYWTYDNGASWTDITPVLPDVRRAAIRSVHPPFFRDKSEGWSIIEYHKEAGSPTTVEPAYSVAHTINGGASWSFTELIYPQLPKWNLVQDAVAAPASLFFIDSLHGWLNIPFAGLSKPGKLLATVDGGNSWSWVNSAGVTGGIVFATLQDGWQFDFTADELYVTHDGCKTWEKVSGVATPPQLSPGTQPRLQGVPIFQDQYKGYLAVQYPGTNSGPTKLVIYSTANTGKSWQLAKVLDRAPEGTDAIFDIVDSTAIVSTGSGATDFSVVPVPLNGRTSDVAASDRGIASLKFADSQNGWILTTPYRILATQNGGANWKDITPLSAAAPVRTTTVPISQHELTSVATSTGALASGLSASASIYGSATHVSKHLGFDMSFVRSTADMSTWWKYSPYYDPYIYLWDNLNRAKQDSNLNSGWVTQVENQGWGVVPIWVGRQAPIGCAVPSTTTYKYYIDEL